MSKEAFSLDLIHIENPCTESWSEMSGDERVRFCSKCRLNVYDLSEMTRAEATELVQKREGRLCVGFYRRADGTIVTRDCRPIVRAIRRRTAALVGFLVAALFTCAPLWRERFRRITSPILSIGIEQGRSARLIDWIDPPADRWFGGMSTSIQSANGNYEP